MRGFRGLLWRMLNADQNRAVTANPVQPGNFTGVLPEFGRVADVTRHFGIKRGTLYNLLADRKIRGVLLRVRGQKSGVRLIEMVSVRDYIMSEMERGQA